MAHLLLKVVWAILTGKTSAKRSAHRHSCAYCRGAGCVPDMAPIDSLFTEACPLCGGSGSGETYSKEAA